jgi:serine/threonine-protein kinase
MEGLPERFGRFRVLAELGRGAMGVVYQAEDATLGRVVAIKTISLAGATGPERDQAEARFLQEARAAARVSHPSIVTIYETGREGDTEFIAMELIEGRDLRDLIRSGDLTSSQALAIAAAAAEGLASAHEQGVVHRDVKPGNIMVLADGRVKIMDFGIARLREPAVKTQTGLLLGSPQYMAPEQIVGRPFDHRADIFSLALVLYEMLTGTKAFVGEDLAELTFKLANVAAPPPSRYARALPPVVDLIVARALRKKPEERYATAAEMARDLRAAIAAGAGPMPVETEQHAADGAGCAARGRGRGR